MRADRRDVMSRKLVRKNLHMRDTDHVSWYLSPSMIGIRSLGHFIGNIFCRSRDEQDVDREDDGSARARRDCVKTCCKTGHIDGIDILRWKHFLGSWSCPKVITSNFDFFFLIELVNQFEINIKQGYLQGKYLRSIFWHIMQLFFIIALPKSRKRHHRSDISVTNSLPKSRELPLLKTSHIFRGTDSMKGSASLEFRDEELRDGFSLMFVGPLFVSS